MPGSDEPCVPGEGELLDLELENRSLETEIKLRGGVVGNSDTREVFMDFGAKTESELETSLAETCHDLNSGRWVVEDIDSHMKRIGEEAAREGAERPTGIR